MFKGLYLEDTAEGIPTYWDGSGGYKLSYIKGISYGSSSWYRIWSDGWIEQGGNFMCSSDGYTLTYQVPFSNVNYSITASGGTHMYGNVAMYNKTSTGCKCWTSDDASFNAGLISWYACGK